MKQTICRENKLESFSEYVCNKLGIYVYRLIDPRNGETFYVGKGKGNRVFDHVRGELKLSSETEDRKSEKLDRIRDIHNEGQKVIHVIHRHDIPDGAIFEVEAALIDAYPGLSNEQGGHGSQDRGPMNAQQINQKYDLPVLDDEPPHKLVLINVNQIEDRSTKDGILHQVQFAWRISVNKAKQAEFVLAVYRGIVIGVFTVDEWLQAIPENFPGRSPEETRYGFVGTPAPDDIWDYYVGDHGKRIENPKLAHVQNPIRYWRI